MLVKPVVIISQCLGFGACRYNGQMQKDEFVEELKSYVKFKPVCPELAIGLGVPRESIRMVYSREGIRLMQSKTGLDLSRKMNEFTDEFFDNVNDVDGFILKTRSPSCGVKDVKVYSSLDKGPSVKKGAGVFGERVMTKYPNLAIEDEGRLKDYKIRHHFLTKIYTLAAFRMVKKSNSYDELNNFHESNRLLFNVYNSKQLKELNHIIRIRETCSIEKIVNNYEKCLGYVLAKAPRYTSNISMLVKILKHIDQRITDKEKEFILDSIHKYKTGHIPLNVPLYLIKAYLIRFDEQNILKQSFFKPYPEELIYMRDSGKVLT